MLKWHKINISGNNFIFIVFLLSSVANMGANYICIKYISKVFWVEGDKLC